MIGDREVVVDDVRVRGLGRASVEDDVTLPPAQAPPTPKTVRSKTVGDSRGGDVQPNDAEDKGVGSRGGGRSNRRLLFEVKQVRFFKFH